MQTALILVRHGETDWNKELRWQGHHDIPLNQTGLAQAEAVGGYLASDRFHAVYASDLSRAQATAEAICRHHPAREIKTDARIRELSFGAWDGLSAQEIDARHGPGTFAAYFADRLHRVPPGGEEVQHLFERVSLFIDDIIESHVGESVVIVAHGGSLRAIISILLTGGVAAWQHIELGNCSVTRIVGKEHGRPVVRLLGATHFLD